LLGKERGGGGKEGCWWMKHTLGRTVGNRGFSTFFLSNKFEREMIKLCCDGFCDDFYSRLLPQRCQEHSCL
jgi:hypothetical protein